MTATSQQQTVLLPPDLRLPDLSRVHTVTHEDLDQWHRTAQAAIAWGPDERNGCTREHTTSTYTWVDADGYPHSPDPWTPALAYTTGTNWYQHGHRTGREGQPATVSTRKVTWKTGDQLHRPDGPAHLSPQRRNNPWWWQGQPAPDDLERLLHTACYVPDLTDTQAHDLLDQAAALTPGQELPVPAQTWLAHVLAANPSPSLSVAFRAWLTLLAA